MLVKGGHLKDEAVGRALERAGLHRSSRAADGLDEYARYRLHALGRHRGGARAGQALGEAVREAKAYVTEAIREGFAPAAASASSAIS